MADTETTSPQAAVEDASRYWHEAVAATEGREPGQHPVEEESSEPEETESVDSEGVGESEEEESKDGETEAESEAPEGEGEEEKDADPWDSVPEDLRKDHEAVLEKAKKYEHEARSNRGRLAALERKYRELSQKPEESPAKGEKKEPATETADSIFDFPEWKEFETNFGADVAGPQRAAMRRMYEAMHSRIQQIEEQAKSLTQTQAERKFVDEYQRFDAEFHQWLPTVGFDLEHDADAEDSGDPGYIRYARANFNELEDFARTDEDYLRWWSNNLNHLTKPNDLMKLFRAFEASRGNTNKIAAEPAPRTNGAQPKTEPRPMTPKRKQQLKSAGTIPPRSAPGPGSRSTDLPDPKDYAFDFFANRATR